MGGWVLTLRFRCYHNAILPEKTFFFGGSLYLTAKSAAFYAHYDLTGFGKHSFPVRCFSEGEGMGERGLVRSGRSEAEVDCLRPFRLIQELCGFGWCVCVSFILCSGGCFLFFSRS